MKKLLLFLLGFELLLGQTMVNGGRQFLGPVDAADSSWMRVKRGPGAPAGEDCDGADTVGRIYARMDAGASNATFYVCANTGAGTYAWELVAGDGNGSVGNGSGGDGSGDETADIMSRISMFQPPIAGTGSPTMWRDWSSQDGTVSNQVPTATEPLRRRHTTAATANSRARLHGDSIQRTSFNPHFAARVAISATTDIRFWTGLSQNVFTETSGNMLESDDPAGNYAAFRFSSSASDTNWTCVTKDGTTQNIIDSGVAVAAGTTAKLEILITSGTSVVFRINGATVCTSTAHLPGATINLRQGMGLLTLTDASRFFDYAYIRTVVNEP